MTDHESKARALWDSMVLGFGGGMRRDEEIAAEIAAIATALRETAEEARRGERAACADIVSDCAREAADAFTDGKGTFFAKMREFCNDLAASIRERSKGKGESNG
jgi:hypothetical protein